jgi:hypothetical protein
MDQFRERFLDAVSRRLPSMFEGTDSRETIGREAQRLFESYRGLIKDKPSWLHLNMAVLVLAAYKALESRVADRKLLLRSLSESFRQPAAEMVKSGMRSSLDAAEDPLKELEKSSQSMITWKFGETFTVSQETAKDGNAFANVVTRCFWHEFFRSQGVPELTWVFCDWDSLWVGEISSEHHAVKFSRPTTLSAGDNNCRFQFDRVQKQDDGSK